MQKNRSRVIADIRRGVTALIVCLVTSILALSHCDANPQAQAHYKRGLQLSLKKQWPQAEAEYRKAIALDPKNATYRSSLADVLAAQGKFDAAQDSYQQSDKVKKENPAPTYKKPATRKPASTQPPTKRTPSTRPPATKPATSKPTTTKPRTPQTGTSSSTSRTATSGSSTSGRAKIPGFPLPPAGDDGTSQNGDMQIVTRDGKVITIKPDSNINLGEIFGEMEKSKTTTGGGTVTNPGTEDHAITVIEDDPHYLKGMDYAEQEKWALAETELRAALKKDPTNIEYWDTLGSVYFRWGKYDMAEKAHRSAVKLEPEDGYLRAQLASDLLKLGRRDEALKEARQARQLGLEDHEVFDELGLG